MAHGFKCTRVRKKSNIRLMRTKKNAKELNYRPIDLLSVLYKILKVISNTNMATLQSTKKTGWLEKGIFYNG